MRSLVISCFILLALAFTGPTSAQPPAPPAPQAVETITLTVNSADLQVIGDALQTQPYGKVVPLLAKLQGQITAQQTAPPGAAPK